jgi:hypothetical protein
MNDVTIEDQKALRRKAMVSLERIMKGSGTSVGKEFFATDHEFVDGLYIRSVRVPAGTLITTEIHKHNHPMFLLEGKATIFSEDGIQEIEAPFHTITKAGTKRVVYMNTETLCACVYRTDKTTVAEVEEEIFAKSFEELGINYNPEGIWSESLQPGSR